MKKNLTIMKTLFMVTFLLALNITQGQYFQQRFNLNYSVANRLRNERFNSGIRTHFNYIGGNPAYFYQAGIGTSFNNTQLTAPDNVADRMRFTLIGTTGAILYINKGYEFFIPGSSSLNSSGNSIAEIDNGAGNGGFVAVGAVSNNAGANVLGGSNILFAKLNAVGGIVGASHIDINNGGKDIAWCIRRSKGVTVTGQPTWILCGQSTIGARTDCVVARVLDNGTIVWCKRYNFPAPNGNATCIAKQLCEDVNNNIYVVGTWQAPGGGRIDGLAFKLLQSGVLVWAESFHNNTDVKFEAVRLTNNGGVNNSIVIGGQANNGAMSHMLLLTIRPNGVLGGIRNLLQARDAGGSIYSSDCQDLVETPTGEFFLAGLLSKNGVSVQMMYKVAAGGAGINWYSYNSMLYKDGFGVDYVPALPQLGMPNPGIVMFSSIKNPANLTFSDSHIMKTDLSGGTCPNLCSMQPPSTNQIVLETVNRNGNSSNAGTSGVLHGSVSNYDQIKICNGSCPGADFIRSENKSQSPGLSAASGSVKGSPNPVTGTLKIKFNSLPAGTYQIALTDMQGKVVFQRNDVYNDGSSATNLDMSSLAPGMYLLTVKKDDLVLQQKIMKQ